MRCAWQSLIQLLPMWMREFVDKQGKDTLQELRLRMHAPPQLRLKNETVIMGRSVTHDDLDFCINMVTKYSPWSASSALKCYYAAPGGHRIGVCGKIAASDSNAVCIQALSSLCIRVAREFPGIAKPLSELRGSVLILGKPGSGKTTLLRDYIRLLSNTKGNCVTVIDERQEIFPFIQSDFCFDIGMNTDVLSGCSKEFGIEAALRNTGPTIIAVDEITAESDCDALLRAGWCGVDIIATAHANTKEDLYRRPVYKPLVASQLFDNIVIMHSDKTWHVERMNR